MLVAGVNLVLDSLASTKDAVAITLDSLILGFYVCDTENASTASRQASKQASD
jgi:hypothetical protein